MEYYKRLCYLTAYYEKMLKRVLKQRQQLENLSEEPVVKEPIIPRENFNGLNKLLIATMKKRSEFDKKTKYQVVINALKTDTKVIDLEWYEYFIPF
jgi:hypothetical protein